jgi:enamine deaminase RidA (YjgF/YER057c/UK114 family)
VDSTACATVVRRFAGATANELAICCRPAGPPSGPAHQAEAAYRAMAATLAAHQASFRELACETLFLRDIRRDLPVILDIRARILAGLGQHEASPPPAFIQQAPLDQRAAFELTAAAVAPRRRDGWSVHDVRATPSCACEGCVRSAARLVRLGDQTSLHTTNVYGTGSDAFEQAWNMFVAAERLLEQCGLEFRDVVRTWIHLRDIDRDYDALNRARRAFFRDRRIARRPASTGVQGIPFPDAHDVAMTLHAVKSPRPLDVTVMSTPSLNEAWSYGADFSRGLRLADANRVTLYVSGTASVDETGRTIHERDFAAQVDRMLHNVASLLAPHGATFDDVISAVVYLKHSGDALVLRSMLDERGFAGFPCALLEASLCRPDLLCEAEVVAMLPPATPGV